MLEKTNPDGGSSKPAEKAVKNAKGLNKSKTSSSNSSIGTRHVHNRSPTAESAPKSNKSREISSGFGVKAKSPTSSGREKITA